MRKQAIPTIEALQLAITVMNNVPNFATSIYDKIMGRDLTRYQLFVNSGKFYRL